MENIENLSFEEALKELEGIIKLLEKGDCEIEKAVEYYEKGSLLREHFDKKLKSEKEKIEIINKISVTDYVKPSLQDNK